MQAPGHREALGSGSCVHGRSEGFQQRTLWFMITFQKLTLADG